MTENKEIITYAEAYKIWRALVPELEPGPCGEIAEAYAWATAKCGSIAGVTDELLNEFESLKAEGIFTIQHG